MRGLGRRVSYHRVFNNEGLGQTSQLPWGLGRRVSYRRVFSNEGPGQMSQ